MPKDGHGSASPFVEVEFEGQRQRTSTKPKNLNPSWNEKLVFNVKNPQDLSTQTIEVFVYNDNKHGHHKNFLGKVRISGMSVPFPEQEALVQKYPLDKRVDDEYYYKENHDKSKKKKKERELRKFYSLGTVMEAVALLHPWLIGRFCETRGDFSKTGLVSSATTVMQMQFPGRSRSTRWWRQVLLWLQQWDIGEGTKLKALMIWWSR
ncbi:UNVERIFIED_CONTAM: protein QUIRKY [Sesamum radiatum]|uniref:Protein QUIRKY n=1 Tax=Sesamum radiatum TaxID=300843 RepID=A0AAW2M4C0_SESRA